MNSNSCDDQPDEYLKGCYYDNWEDYVRAIEDEEREEEEYRHYDHWDN